MARAPKAPASRLRLWRTEHGYTIEELADLCGLSAPFISRLERGQRGISPRMRVLVARRLGVRVRDLFDVEPLGGEIQ